jgi:hypothetical protein
MASRVAICLRNFRFEQHVIDFHSISIFLVVDPFRHSSGELVPLSQSGSLFRNNKDLLRCFKFMNLEGKEDIHWSTSKIDVLSL